MFFTGKKTGKLTGKKPVKNKVVFTCKKTSGITTDKGMNLLHFGSDLADTWNPGSRSVIQDSYPDTIIWLRQLKFKGRYTWHWWECLLLACSVVSSCFVLLLSVCTERTECTQHFEHE